ncbi:MAG: hypothetical protein PHH31_09135, partial [Acidaminococcaceae bacterium]|nr:hypothetical protein [Acidaminococcaceae bacterium]
MVKKLFSIKNIVLLSLVMVMACAGLAFAAGAVPQTSSLTGTVVAEGLVSEGTMVSEGQILVKVITIAGTAAAARANCSGKVVSVSVVPGSLIKAGQV